MQRKQYELSHQHREARKRAAKAFYERNKDNEEYKIKQGLLILTE